MMRVKGTLRTNIICLPDKVVTCIADELQKILHAETAWIHPEREFFFNKNEGSCTISVSFDLSLEEFRALTKDTNYWTNMMFKYSLQYSIEDAQTYMKDDKEKVMPRVNKFYILHNDKLLRQSREEDCEPFSFTATKEAEEFILDYRSNLIDQNKPAKRSDFYIFESPTNLDIVQWSKTS